MKKSVSMLLAAAMVVFLFAGCGSKSNSTADTKKEETTNGCLFFFGGPEGIRTHDLTDANRTLSQTVQFYAPQTTQETADNNQILSEKSEKSIWPCSILHGTSQEASILR